MSGLTVLTPNQIRAKTQLRRNQLQGSKSRTRCYLLKRMVGLEGFEPPTHGLGNRCSILLSYRPILCFQ